MSRKKDGEETQAQSHQGTDSQPHSAAQEIEVSPLPTSSELGNPGTEGLN